MAPGQEPGVLDEMHSAGVGGFAVPMAIGLRSGHVSHRNVTLAFGVRAELDLLQGARADLSRTRRLEK